MTDKEKLEKIKELADKMYSNMAYLTSDTRPIRKAMDEYHQFIVNEYHKEEPISEDLEEAAKQFATDTKTGKVDVVKQSSFFWGAIYHKQQMMANAVDGVVHHFDGCEWASVHYNDPKGVPMTYFVSSEGLSAGDKVKIILAKEG